MMRPRQFVSYKSAAYYMVIDVVQMAILCNWTSTAIRADQDGVVIYAHVEKISSCEVHVIVPHTLS